MPSLIRRLPILRLSYRAPAGQTASRRERSLLADFGRNESGAIALIFSMVIIVLVAVVGGAVDYGRAVTVREQMQRAVDASVLAAVRIWQTEKDLGLAEQMGRQYYDSNKPGDVESTITAFNLDNNRNAITMVARANVVTPFLSVVMTGGFTLTSQAEALLAVGGNSETNLEVSMMLDVTGSMCQPCTKISDLKEAAKDLIDIVVWDDQSEYTSRVAIVPFAEAVHLGSTALVNQVRGGVKASTCLDPGSPCTGYSTGAPTNSQWAWGAPATWFRYTRADGYSRTARVSDYCVTERIGANRYTDEAPNNGTDKVGPLYAGTSTSENCSMVRTADLEVNSIQPLSNDRTLLKRRIDKLDLSGTTAGQIGTAWAWYMLAPKWAHLWPNGNRPAAYHTPKTQKIAILMTDGEYNTAHCRGVLSADSSIGGASSRINCNAHNAPSDPQADNVCSAMKNGTGITVYTVGFALGGNQTAINTLRACASDESKFYNAEDGVALKQAFRDIALQIARLRLSQ